ncbi:MAG: DUF4044 domain-containing protein [Clostridia bacterium]|nr:DUF4044 domain-containing protein [Clostridia bacterium]
MSSKTTKLATRIVALLMAVLMLGGVLIGAIQVFAMDVIDASVIISNTGESSMSTWIIVVAVIALVILTGVTVVPKLLKKD